MTRLRQQQPLMDQQLQQQPLMDQQLQQQPLMDQQLQQQPLQHIKEQNLRNCPFQLWKGQQ